MIYIFYLLNLFKLWLLHKVGDGNTHRYSFQGVESLRTWVLWQRKRLAGDEETFLADEGMAW